MKASNKCFVYLCIGFVLQSDFKSCWSQMWICTYWYLRYTPKKEVHAYKHTSFSALARVSCGTFRPSWLLLLFQKSGTRRRLSLMFRMSGSRRRFSSEFEYQYMANAIATNAATCHILWLVPGSTVWHGLFEQLFFPNFTVFIHLIKTPVCIFSVGSVLLVWNRSKRRVWKWLLLSVLHTTLILAFSGLFEKSVEDRDHRQSSIVIEGRPRS